MGFLIGARRRLSRAGLSKPESFAKRVGRVSQSVTHRIKYLYILFVSGISDNRIETPLCTTLAIWNKTVR